MTEVLAPAGSFESIVAAVRAGADAVYFGAGNFNARRNAKNFSFDDIAEACQFARVRGVKTYLTLNTLIKDSEMAQVLETANKAAEIGIDALIVQDLGLAKLLKKYLPNMPLHASTQMSIHSADALQTLKELGFTRVVPAREMDKRSLMLLCEKAAELGLEVEVFVHGALCMCLSGQCYLSSMLGGRSGNRGLCAQPCRLEFSVAGGTGHDLSLKDLSLVSSIKELTDMGVTSFKIEGRMKRPEYVAAATAVVRAAADGKEIPQSAIDVLSGIFSRNGHTDGYYINKLGKTMFGTRTEADEKMSAKTINLTHEMFRNERQNIALCGKFTLKKGQPSKLEIVDKDGNKVVVYGQEPMVAEHVCVTKEFVTEKLSKCGGTPFYFENVLVEVDDGLAFSGSNIGAIRREAFEKLETKRSEYDGNRAKDSTTDEFSINVKTQKRKIVKTVARFRTAQQIPCDLEGVSAVVLPTSADFSNLKIPDNIPVLAEIPRGIMNDGKRISERLSFAKQNGAKAALCGNLAAFQLAKEAGLVPVADFGMNIFNSESVSSVKDMGAKAVVLSFEASLSQINSYGGDIPRGVITYGRLPLMLVRNCPGKNGNGCASCGGSCTLTDRKNIEFPVMCNGEFSEIFNSRVLWMFDRKGEINADFEVLYFTDETKERCTEIIKAAGLKNAPDCEHTRGLFYREIM